MSPHHCPSCGKLKLTRSGAPHKCLAPEIERWHILERALEFYADPHNYGIGGGTSERIHADGGKVARHAIVNLPKSKL